MITIWFEPHKTSLDNEAGLASGWNDVDLSELGAGEQLQDCAERYGKLGIEAVFSSDMQRAYKTAVAVTKDRNIPVYVDSRLRECNYGDLTQAPKSLVESKRVDYIAEPFPNGESYESCMKRIGEFLVYLKENFDNKTVLIIGHRATHYGLDHHILGTPIKTCITVAWQWQPGWRYEYN